MRHPFRAVKWWFQRANYKVPECDCWDYKYTLVENIRQGLEFLLHDGQTDWENPIHKKTYKELQFVLDWARAFPYYDRAVFATNEKEKKELEKVWAQRDYIVCTREDLEAWQKRTDKAFKYLGKNIHGLWD